MLIPEQLFDNPETEEREEKEAEGISAVKAIQLAQQQGQKIFTITQDNYNEAISQISLSSGAMEDIHNAINAGKEVTVHQSAINFNGWNGSGYIILDPDTGTGAYMIGGGADGGKVWLSKERASFLSGIAMGIAGSALLYIGLAILSNPLSYIFIGALILMFILVSNAIRAIHTLEIPWSAHEVNCYEYGVKWAFILTSVIAILQGLITPKSTFTDIKNAKQCYGN